MNSRSCFARSGSFMKGLCFAATAAKRSSSDTTFLFPAAFASPELYAFIQPLNHSLIHAFIYGFIYPFMDSFIR